MSSSWPREAKPRTIPLPGNGTREVTFEVPDGVVVSVEAVFAEVTTGIAPSGAMLEAADPSGRVIARKRQTEPIDAATQGSATWALRLADDPQPAAGGVGGMIQRDGAAAPQNVPSGFLNQRTVALKHNVLIWQAGVSCNVGATPSNITLQEDGLYEVMASIAWTPAGAGEYGFWLDWLMAGLINDGDAVTHRRIVNQPNYLEASRIVRCRAGAVITQGVAQSSGVGINAPIGFLQVVRTGNLP